MSKENKIVDNSRMSRREFLQLLTVIGGATVFTSCIGREPEVQVVTATPEPTNTSRPTDTQQATTPTQVEATTTNTPTVTSTPTVENTPTAEATATGTSTVTRTATAENTPTAEATTDWRDMATQEAEGVRATATAVAERVEGKVVIPGYTIRSFFDRASDVLVAQNPDQYGNRFENTIGLGTEGWLAEPGSILYGPDVNPDLVRNNPHADYFSPITQEMFENPEAEIAINEGAFIVASARKMNVRFELGDDKNKYPAILLNGADQHMWLLVVRGLFADETRDDRNVNAHFSGYKPGNAQALRYPRGAFISEGQVRQFVETGHTNRYTDVVSGSIALASSNCGDTGCLNVSIAFVDLNTRAWSVVRHNEEQGFVRDKDNWYISAESSNPNNLKGESEEAIAEGIVPQVDKNNINNWIKGKFGQIFSAAR
jgi:hypothetical protein